MDVAQEDSSDSEHVAGTGWVGPGDVDGLGLRPTAMVVFTTMAPPGPAPAPPGSGPRPWARRPGPARPGPRRAAWEAARERWGERVRAVVTWLLGR